MSQQNPLLRGSSFRKGQSRERRAVKSDEMGRGLEGKQKSKALSEAINSKKKIKIISPALLSFSRNRNQKPKNKTKQPLNTKLAGTVEMCKRAETASAPVHSCPGRDSTQRNELSKQKRKQKNPLLKIDLQKFYKPISI